MASDHLSATFKGLLQTLEEAPILSDILIGVFPFFAHKHGSYYLEPGRIAIQLTLGDSDDEDPQHNESTGGDILPTTVGLVCDTQVADDSKIWINEDEDSLLDLEYKVIRALQSSSWWNAATHHQGWEITQIERDALVLTETGEEDPDTRRFVITLTVDVLLDRDDGPAR